MCSTARKRQADPVTDLKELRNQVVRANIGGWSPTRQVLARIAALLPSSAILVDVDVQSQTGNATGRIFIVSELRVLLASFEGATVDRTDPHDRSVVKVTTWRRSDLCLISLEGGEDGRDPNVHWQGSDDETWPLGTVLKLTYRDGQTIGLPMARNPADGQLAAVHSITRSLLADLESEPRRADG